MNVLMPTELRNVVFSNYGAFVQHARRFFYSLNSRGIFYDEIVNEAIVAIFDVKAPFNSQQSVIKFMQNAIYNIGHHEKSLLKDDNFLVRMDECGEYSLLDRMDKVVFIDLPSDEFIKIYEILEQARFGIYASKKICNKCSCSRMYSRKDGLLQCAACGYRMSLTAGTYVKNMKMSYSVFYKLIIEVCKNTEISSIALSKKLSITQKAAWKRKHLILSVMKNIGCNKPCAVMDKIFTNMDSDKNKVDIILTNKKRRYSHQDIINIKRLKNNNIMPVKEIAEKYNSDCSKIYKITKGLLYANY